MEKPLQTKKNYPELSALILHTLTLIFKFQIFMKMRLIFAVIMTLY